MLEFSGKKLLYLGGISRARFVVERARKLGAYVIVADYYEDSPAKAVADEGVLIDAMDVGALTAFGKERKIDGIMTGYADILLPVCKEVAANLSIPCYYNDVMLKNATDKEFFKELCQKYGVPVPKTYNIDLDNVSKSADGLSYPVFIKPLDASGSRGASACYSRSEFEEKFAFALQNSKKKVVTVEDFLTGVEFILDYAVVDGNPRLLSMADRYVTDGRSAAVNSPNIMIMPSKYLEKYQSTVESSVLKLFKGENFDNGILFYQGYANDEKIAFYENGCRLGGTWPYVDEFFYGINPMDMLFRHALTGKMLTDGSENKISAAFKGCAAILYFLANRPEGRIACVKGIEETQYLPYVVHLMQYYFEGDAFDMDRQTDVRFLAVHLVANDFEELKQRIQTIYSLIDYQDADGNTLLAPVYDPNQLTGY